MAEKGLLQNIYIYFLSSSLRNSRILMIEIWGGGVEIKYAFLVIVQYHNDVNRNPFFLTHSSVRS